MSSTSQQASFIKNIVMITDEKYDTIKKTAKTKNGSTVIILAVTLSARIHRAWDVSSDFRYLEMTVLYLIIKEVTRSHVVSFD